MENTDKTRIEHDSMGELKVPAHAMWGAQTQRAINNFTISNTPMPKQFIQGLALIKLSAALANQDLELLSDDLAHSIIEAATTIYKGKYYEQFPIDIFQTGSGTSTNMNANEVIAYLASQNNSLAVHPNDHVNMSQSSNDVIPTTIHVSACIALYNQLLPALENLSDTLTTKAYELKDIVKTGRTHLMDAMPITMQQEFDTFALQIKHGIERIEATLPRLQKLPIGGTAVGTGINAHPEFRHKIVEILKAKTQIDFTSNENLFEAISSQDAAVELSGQLKTIAVSLFKICNDLRLMNSGPLAGLNEICLPPLQPGSSIMPGKINPVIPEAVMQVCAQVIGNDMTITIGAQNGNFQLNTMLPVIASNLLHSIELLANASNHLAKKAIINLTVNNSKIEENLAKNPILVTALNSILGYEEGAKIAKKAYAENKSILEVALEMTDLPEDELKRILDPKRLTLGGIVK